LSVVNKTRTYATNDTLSAANYNADRDEIIAGVNSIDNAQIDAGAAIEESKIAFSGSGHSHGGAGDGNTVLVTSLDPTALTALYYLRVNAGGTAIEAVTAPTAVVNRAFGFYIGTTPLVTGTNLSWNPVVPQAMTCVKLWGHVKTAPAVQAINITVSIVGGATVATLSIPAGSTDANTTSFITAALTAGMVLQVSITQVGTGTAGDALSLMLETTQP
jgi:hypothetical protein